MKNNLLKFFKSILLLLFVTIASTTQAKPKILGLSIINNWVTTENCNDLSVIPGVSGTVRYNPNTKTLTLENATIASDSTSTNEVMGIDNLHVDSLTIVLKGTNTISLNCENRYGYGLFLRRNTTITGYGTLNIDGYGGIFICLKSSVLIDKSTINIDVTKRGILGFEKGTSLTIRNAHVTTKGEEGSIYGLSSLILENSPIYQPEGATYDTSRRCLVVGGEKVKSLVSIGSPFFFDVMLIDYDENEDDIIDILTEATGLSAEECEKLAKSAPCKVLARRTLSEAEELCDRLTSVDAIATIENADTWRKPTGIDNYGLKIAGYKVSSENYDDLSVIPDVSGTMKYNPYTKKLTLDNVTIKVFDSLIFNDTVQDLRIVVKGTNNLSSIRGIDDGFVAACIKQPTTITGGGVLNLESGFADGIFILNNASLLIENCTVNAKGYRGISGPENIVGETLTIRNANVTAEGEDGSIRNLKSLILENNQIVQPDGAAFDNDQHCVALDGEMVKSKIVIAETLLYDVVLIDYGTSKIDAIKILKEITGYGLKDCKDLIESAPCVLLESLTQSEAQAICDRFAEVGCTAYIYRHGTWDPTGIETIETNAASTGKRGIYSIGGIYLGNDMDALPKGIYIKDGKKVIK